VLAQLRLDQIMLRLKLANIRVALGSQKHLVCICG
jgi:hypothetical protein